MPTLRAVSTTSRTTILFVLGAVLLVTWASMPALAQEPSSGIRILLTNDDGFDARGITAMRDALVDAGHEVTIVAPLGERDGTGMGVTMSGTIDYYRQEDGVWAVDGTPSDAVTLGLVHVLRETPPDLVVSGLNAGQTVGADILSSGTVGGALTAARAGVPAIAASVEVDLRDADAGVPGAGTEDAYGAAAELVAEIVYQLVQTGGSGLLPPRTVLNVNYPAVGSAPPDGVRFTSVSRQRGFRQVFSVAGDTGPARVQLAAADPARAEEGSDLALLAAGFATISVLDGDWDAGRSSWQGLLERLIIER